MKEKKILVVDDHLSILDIIEMALTPEGYAIEKAAGGMEAFKKINVADAAGTPFDLLITDYMMPDINGLELLIKIKESNLYLPYIVITANSDRDVLKELMKFGCKHFADKPLILAELKKTVKEIFLQEEKRIQLARQAEIRVKKIEEEKEKLKFEAEHKSRSEEQIRSQVYAAKTSYKQLIKIQEENCNVDLCFKHRAFAELGGDFIDIRNTENGVDIFLADVAGHDMAASYNTVLLKAFFDENCRHQRQGSEFFKLINNLLLSTNKKESLFNATAVFLRVDLKNLKCTIVSAAHPATIFCESNNNRITRIASRSAILGVFEEEIFEELTIGFLPGDRFFLFSDGITGVSRIDGPTGKRTVLGERGLQKLVYKYKDHNLNDAIKNIWDEIFRFCRFKPVDDMLLVGFQIPVALEDTSEILFTPHFFKNEKILFFHNPEEAPEKFDKLFGEKKSNFETVSDAEKIVEKTKKAFKEGNPYKLLVLSAGPMETKAFELCNNLKNRPYAPKLLASVPLDSFTEICKLSEWGCLEFIEPGSGSEAFLRKIDKILEWQNFLKEDSLLQNQKLEIKKGEMSLPALKKIWMGDYVKGQQAAPRVNFENQGFVQGNLSEVSFSWRFRSQFSSCGAYFELREEKGEVDLFFADVCGHDCVSFYTIVLLKKLLEQKFLHHLSPQVFFKEIDRVTWEKIEPDISPFAAFFLHLKKKNQTGQAIFAGSPSIIHLDKRGKLTPIESEKDGLLGLNDGEFNPQIFSFQKGDRFFIPSGGLISLKRKNGLTGESTTLGFTCFVDKLDTSSDMSLEDSVEFTWQKLFQFSNFRFSRDIFFCGLEIL
ncbi:SpoIIE family protein phosphatase [Candidatus Riflebacteria bacterium]